MQGTPTTLRWRIVADELPPAALALHVGDQVNAVLQGRIAAALGTLPPALADHTPDGGLPQGDPHPFYLPEDADGDGWLDHMVLHVPRGLAEDWRRLLAELVLAGAYGGLLPPFALTGEWLGHLEDAAAPGRLLGAARVWRSVTPYVSDDHLKRRRNPEEERRRLTQALLKDLRRRGYPAPEAVELLDTLDRGLRPKNCATRRLRGTKRAGRSNHPGAAFRVSFADGVRGPVAVGFACHLGLGLFAREGGVMAEGG